MYEDYYKFNNSPFRLSPDPNFFFGSKGHKRALSYLRYGLNQKEGFIVITGTPGTGKTTIARSLLQELGREKVVVSQLNTTHLQADDVLRMVAASFGLEHENAPKATILKRLEAFFTSRFRAGFHVLLMVDEAQNLPKESLEELRMLSNFYLGKDALIQIFLLGQQQFRDNLYSSQMEQLRQRVVASCHLEPLNISESREYIEYRLNQVGWQGDPAISDRAFARIFSLTKGIPRRINTFCDRLLLFGSLEEIHNFQDEHVKAVAKELAYEVSAKGVGLSDIKPDKLDSSEEIIPDEIKPESETAENTSNVVELDTEQLKEFSDDIKPSEVAAAEPNTEDMPDSEPPTESDRPNVLQFVGQGNTVRERKSEPVSTPTPAQAKPDNSPDWWELVALCVEHYNEPSKFRGLSGTKTPVLAGMATLLKVAVGSKEIPEYMRTGVLADITDDEIQEAIRLYIKNVLLSSSANYYLRLGLESDADSELIRTHYKFLFRLFQPVLETNDENWDETYTRRINQAYGILRSPEKRAEYDRFLSTRKANIKAAKKEKADVDSIVEEQKTADKTGEYVDIKKMAESSNLNLPDSKFAKFKWPAVASVAIILLSGVVGYLVYQPTSEMVVADLQIPEEQQVLTEPVKKEAVVVKDKDSENLEKILEPVESIFIPKQVKLQDIATAVEKTIKENVQPPVKTSSIETLAEKKTSKPVLQARIGASSPVEVEPKEPETKIVKLAVIADQKAVQPKAPAPIARKIEKEIPPVEPESELEKVEPAKTKPVEEVVNKTPPMEEQLAMLSAPAIIKPEAIADKKVFDKITNTELKQFITRFTLAYEEGNLKEYMKYFAVDAKTNDAPNRNAIATDYASLFDSTEMRVIDLQGLQWQVKDKTATGKGDFLVTVLRKGGEAMRNFAGSIKLEVEKVGGQLKLKGMYHAYGSDED